MTLVSVNDMMESGSYYVNSARLPEISASPANRVPTAESGVHPSYVLTETNNCAFTAMCKATEKLAQSNKISKIGRNKFPEQQNTMRPGRVNGLKTSTQV